MRENPSSIEAPRNNALFYARILLVSALAGVSVKADEPELQIRQSQKPDKSYLIPSKNTSAENEYLVCEELPAGRTVYPEKESFEGLVARVDKILKAGVPYQLTERINRLHPRNICYAGDSYMVGITHRRGQKVVRENVQAKVGRPLIANGGEWEDDDIKKYAIEALNNPNCRLLVLNGGLNDLYTDCEAVDEAEARVKRGYEEIFALAWEKDRDIIVFDMPKLPMKSKFKAEINAATERLNAFLKEIGAIQLIDTDEVIDKFANDKMHPTPKSYRKLFRQIKRRIK